MVLVVVTFNHWRKGVILEIFPLFWSWLWLGCHGYLPSDRSLYQSLSWIHHELLSKSKVLMMRCYYLFTDTIYDEDEVLLALAEQVQVVDCISEKSAGSPNSRPIYSNLNFKFGLPVSKLVIFLDPVCIWKQTKVCKTRVVNFTDFLLYSWGHLLHWSEGQTMYISCW